MENELQAKLERRRLQAEDVVDDAKLLAKPVHLQGFVLRETPGTTQGSVNPGRVWDRYSMPEFEKTPPPSLVAMQARRLDNMQQQPLFEQLEQLREEFAQREVAREGRITKLKEELKQERHLEAASASDRQLQLQQLQELRLELQDAQRSQQAVQEHQECSEAATTNDRRSQLEEIQELQLELQDSQRARQDVQERLECSEAATANSRQLQLQELQELRLELQDAQRARQVVQERLERSEAANANGRQLQLQELGETQLELLDAQRARQDVQERLESSEAATADDRRPLEQRLEEEAENRRSVEEALRSGEADAAGTRLFLEEQLQALQREHDQCRRLLTGHLDEKEDRQQGTERDLSASLHERHLLTGQVEELCQECQRLTQERGGALELLEQSEAGASNGRQLLEQRLEGLDQECWRLSQHLERQAEENSSSQGLVQRLEVDAAKSRGMLQQELRRVQQECECVQERSQQQEIDDAEGRHALQDELQKLRQEYACVQDELQTWRQGPGALPALVSAPLQSHCAQPGSQPPPAEPPVHASRAAEAWGRWSWSLLQRWGHQQAWQLLVAELLERARREQHHDLTTVWCRRATAAAAARIAVPLTPAVTPPRSPAAASPRGVMPRLGGTKITRSPAAASPRGVLPQPTSSCSAEARDACGAVAGPSNSGDAGMGTHAGVVAGASDAAGVAAVNSAAASAQAAAAASAASAATAVAAARVVLSRNHQRNLQQVAWNEAFFTPGNTPAQTPAATPRLGEGTVTTYCEGRAQGADSNPGSGGSPSHNMGAQCDRGGALPTVSSSSPRAPCAQDPDADIQRIPSVLEEHGQMEPVMEQEAWRPGFNLRRPLVPRLKSMPVAGDFSPSNGRTLPSPGASSISYATSDKESQRIWRPRRYPPNGNLSARSMGSLDSARQACSLHRCKDWVDQDNDTMSCPGIWTPRRYTGVPEPSVGVPGLETASNVALSPRAPLRRHSVGSNLDQDNDTMSCPGIWTPRRYIGVHEPSVGVPDLETASNVAPSTRAPLRRHSVDSNLGQFESNILARSRDWYDRVHKS